MDTVTKLIQTITTINDPTTLVFTSCVLALGVAGLGLYVAVLALKHLGRRP